jgi:hypothetical protein
MGSLFVSFILPLTGLRIDTIGSSEPAGPEFVRESFRSSSRIVLNSDTGMLSSIYLIVTVLFFTFISIHFIKILWLYSISEKKRSDYGTILSSKGIKSPFSFFNWIFIPDNISGSEERHSIIAHESVHVSQYHSADNLLFELVTAIMWFNPLVWTMKKNLHLIHEFLADAGTLDAGIDRLKYQAFLLNQVSEDKLISLPSGLNNSIIKKRMIMMTKSNSNNRSKFKVLSLIPFFAILLLSVGMINGFFPQEVKAGNHVTKTLTIYQAETSRWQILQQDTAKTEIIRKKVTVKEKNTVKDSVKYVVNEKRANPVKVDEKVVDGKRALPVKEVVKYKSGQSKSQSLGSDEADVRPAKLRKTNPDSLSTNVTETKYRLVKVGDPKEEKTTSGIVRRPARSL